MNSYDELLSQAQAAFGRADWKQAKSCYEDALAQRDTPAARDGLGLALWWLNEIGAAHQQRTQAYLDFKQSGDYQKAAFLAAWLAREQVFLRGNTSAMLGWFARAESLLEQDQDSSARGWLDIYRASMVSSPAALKETALRVIQFARRLSQPGLEAFALVNAGYAEISLGRVKTGMEWIDEAMTAATSGEVGDFFIVSEIFCVTLSACELAGDWDRTRQWCEIAMAYAQQFHSPFLSAYCRTTYGGLMAKSGRWEEADAALTEAIAAFEAGHHALRLHALIKLADLRIDQGRIEEARLLLDGLEDQAEAVIPLARLHLSLGDPPAARSLLANALSQDSLPPLARAPLLQVYIQSLLAAQDVQGALEKAGELAEIADLSQSDFLGAQADLTIGQVKRRAQQAGADTWFHAALQRLHGFENSLLAGRAKLELAHLLRLSDPHGSAMWARAALAGFERLGAGRDADEAANLLRELGLPGRASGKQLQALTGREAEIFALLAHGLTNREIAERLFISPKTAEHHVSSILGKLNLRSRTEAAALAARRADELKKPGGE